MEDGYWKLKEKAHHREEWSLDIWTCRQADHLKKKEGGCGHDDGKLVVLLVNVMVLYYIVNISFSLINSISS